DAAGAKGAHRRQDGAQHEHRAGDREGDRREVAHGAHQPAQALDERLARAPGLPAAVQHEGEEHRQRDEPEPDQVGVALLEHGQAGRGTARASARPGLAGGHQGSYVPDLVLLDLGLPGLDGVDVARRLRADGDVPILMLTARDALESRVEGLDSGADDYLVKPFERQELLARMRALLRRRPPRGAAALTVGDLALNPDTHEVRRGERDVELTQREFELLEYLMRNERIVVSRQRLLDELWGYDPFSQT